MTAYILQSIAFQLLFLLTYECFLKKETFFNYNRAYLLITPVLSLILPLLKLPFLQQAFPAEGFIMLPEVFLGQDPSTVVTVESAVGTSEAIPPDYWWLLIYTGGFLLSLGFFLKKLRTLRQLFSHQAKSLNAEARLVEVPDSRLACTFYKTIFLGSMLSEKERDQILPHELIHVQQKHTLDLLFFEGLKIIFWFNPLIYIYQNRISVLHEFLADAGVVKKLKKQDYFQQLLNSGFNTEDISFINQFFNHSIIKKRIVMLQKNRSKSTSKFKFLIMLPLMLAMMTYVACSEDGSNPGTTEGMERFNYTVYRSGEMDAETKEKHDNYESFLFNNSDYVGWARIDFQNQSVNYSVHPKDQPVPEGSVEMKVAKPDGREYVFYMNLPKHKNSSVAELPKDESPFQGAMGSDENDVPFAVIDEVPIFPGCEGLNSNEERKKCMSEKINHFVNSNYNTSIGNELDLKGINRIYVQFKITKNGGIEVLGARAPHPALKEEAERVVNLLPQMAPGKQKGEAVDVLYSLPITFRVAE